VYGIALGEGSGTAVFELVMELRRAGIRADLAFGGRGLKGAMKAADRSGARYVILIGDAERADAHVSLKDLESGEQYSVPAGEATAWLLERLGK